MFGYFLYFSNATRILTEIYVHRMHIANNCIEPHKNLSSKSVSRLDVLCLLRTFIDSLTLSEDSSLEIADYTVARDSHSFNSHCTKNEVFHQGFLQ